MNSVAKLIHDLEDKVEPKRLVTADFEQSSRLLSVKSDIKTRGDRRRENRLKREPQAPNSEDRVLNLAVLKMRSALDPKRFYKKNAIKELPKEYQVGTVIEHPADYYTDRMTKKMRKQTLVDELLVDAKFRKTARERYNRIRAKEERDRRKSNSKQSKKKNNRAQRRVPIQRKRV